MKVVTKSLDLVYMSQLCQEVIMTLCLGPDVSAFSFVASQLRNLTFFHTLLSSPPPSVVDHSAYKFVVDSRYLFVSRQNTTGNTQVWLLPWLSHQHPFSLLRHCPCPYLLLHSVTATHAGSTSQTTMPGSLVLSPSRRCSCPPSNRSNFMLSWQRMSRVPSSM